jgi:hypothetical protein
MSVFQHRRHKRDSHSVWCRLVRRDGEGTSLEGGQAEAGKEARGVPVKVTVLLMG